MEAINEVQEKVTTLRCSSSTDAKKLAGSIYSTYQSNPDNDIIIRVIGAGALNQAIKGVIISNKFLLKRNIDRCTAVFPGCILEYYCYWT